MKMSAGKGACADSAVLISFTFGDVRCNDAKYVPKAISGIYDCGVYKNL